MSHAKAHTCVTITGRFPHLFVGDDMLGNIYTGLDNDMQGALDKTAGPFVCPVNFPRDIRRILEVITSEVISDRIRSNNIRSTIFTTVKDLAHISLVQV